MSDRQQMDSTASMRIPVTALNHFLSIDQIAWLTDPRSLTQKLRAFTQNKITFHVLHDGWQDVGETSRSILKLSNEEKTWIRKIEWRFQNILWINAVVVIPESSMLNAVELKKIGNNPIGEILFKDPTLMRDDFIFEKIDNDFVRRSIFRFKKQPLLINERFFSDFFARVDGR